MMTTDTRVEIDQKEGLSVREFMEKIRLYPPIKPDPNELYDIRYFNPSRSEDSQRLKDADRHPEVIRWMVPPRPSTNKELDEIIRENPGQKEDPSILFAVTDKEANEVVGWVQYYQCDLVDQVKQQMEIPEGALVLEISYLKLLPNWPKGTRYIKERDNLVTTENKGVAMSGVRQTLKIMQEMEKTISEQMGLPPRKIVVLDFTSPENKATEAVAKQNGFRKLPEKIDYEGEMDNAWVKIVGE